MAAPNIPAAKRAGLPIDLDRLAREGDGWLTPEDRYALKTRGVCTQLQDGVFMVRVRIPGGVLPTPAARHLARLSRSFGPDWLHLTTRQNVELHWIEARQLPALFDGLATAELSTDSAWRSFDERGGRGGQAVVVGEGGRPDGRSVQHPGPSPPAPRRAGRRSCRR